MQLPIEQIPLDRIHDEAPELPRFRAVLGDLRVLKASIKARGLVRPPVVWCRAGDDGAEVAVILDGHRRIAAIRELLAEAEEVPAFTMSAVSCVVFRGDAAEARTTALELHQGGEGAADINPGDAAVEIGWLLGTGMLQERAAERTGVSQGWISRLRKVAHRLLPDGIEALRREELTLDQAVLLARISGTDGPNEATQRPHLENLKAATAREREAVRKAKRNPGRPLPEQARDFGHNLEQSPADKLAWSPADRLSGCDIGCRLQTLASTTVSAIFRSGGRSATLDKQNECRRVDERTRRIAFCAPMRRHFQTVLSHQGAGQTGHPVSAACGAVRDPANRQHRPRPLPPVPGGRR